MLQIRLYKMKELSKAPMPMEVCKSPPIYCFILFYCLVRQTIRTRLVWMNPWTPKNSTPKGQKRKEKTTNPRVDPRPVGKKIPTPRRIKKFSRKQDFETHQEHFDFEIVPKFSETHVFRGTILYPFSWSTLLIDSNKLPAALVSDGKRFYWSFI